MLYAHGCKRADAEISLIHDYLLKNGYEITASLKEADMVFVCTCGFDASSESVSLNILSKAVNTIRADAKAIAFGCLAGINEDAIKKRCGDHVITVPPRSLNDLDHIIEADVSFKSVLDDNKENVFFVNQEILFKTCNGYLTDGTPDGINVTSRNIFSPIDNALVNLRSARNLVDKCISRLSQVTRLIGLGNHKKWISGVLLSIGCPGECTYCGIRRAAGPLNSIPMQTVIKRFRYSIDQGNRAVALVAADVGAYGQDRETNVVYLLEELFNVREDYMLLISDFHPRWLAQYSDDVIRLLAQNQKRVEHISIPIQSGSDRILSLMKRKVSATEISRHIKKLKRAAPDIPVTTHVMVGFPGETNDDFKQTLDLLGELDFNYVCAFGYTDRPDIPAARLPEKVSRWTKYRRLLTLQHKFKC
jgi:tRNA A37 methylthiotransferase MiaB